ncbi:hypothetical protein GCM10007108_10400 [Thermogymnomonas acidicola]|uniref:PIN domain-containing protein n=1 Tax=Thermogymnomonas acidicola TaxID=399579 RepID=A0AA37BRG2_9ARCH|nr:PIN domain-containing protein [Thermogymnomonas acidicola]GGM74396.1 hypothetical protein GCM10007108_10400 [Thermogymnomonas acidicola]
MDTSAIVDTNVLIYAALSGIDVRRGVSEQLGIHRVFVPLCVLRELEALRKSVRHASLALEMASRMDTLESEGSGDDCIVSVASRTGMPVITDDAGLRARLRTMGIRTISMSRNGVFRYSRGRSLDGAEELSGPQGHKERGR